MDTRFVRFPCVGAVLMLVTVFVLGLLLETIGVNAAFLRAIAALGLLLVVPGAMLLIIVGETQLRVPTFLLYAVGLSAALLMAVGVASSLLLPVLGITRPFDIVPLAGVLGLLIGGLTAVAARTDTATRMSWMDVTDRLRWLVDPAPLFLLSLPVASIASVLFLNQTGVETPLLAVLLVVAFLPFILVLRTDDGRLYLLGLWVAALVLLYHQTLWWGTYPIEMWMPVVTVELGRWVPVIGSGTGHEGLLPLSVLYPMLSVVAGVSSMTQVEVLNPLLMSVLPVTAYELYRRYVPPQEALLGGAFIAFVHTFYWGMWPYATRDGIATLFLVLLVLALLDDELRDSVRLILVVLFLALVCVSHYGVGGIAVAVLVGIVSLRILFNQILSRPADPRKVSTLYPVFGSLFLYLWYLFTGGEKAQMFIHRVSGLFTGITLSGPTTRSLGLPSPPSVTALKLLYIGITGLAALGIAASLYDRYIPAENRFHGEFLFPAENRFHDEFLFLGASLLAVLGATFLGVGQSFGTERVLAMVYAMMGIFPVIGGLFVGKVLSKLAGKKSQSLHRRGRHVVYASLAVVLAALLLTGSGVVAEYNSHDYSKSKVLSNDDLATRTDPRFRWLATYCPDCNGDAVAWLVAHRRPGTSVYTDARPPAVEFYAMTVTAETDVSPGVIFAEEYPLQRQNHGALDDLRSAVPSNMYVRLHSANSRTNRYDQTRWGTELVPLSAVRPGLQHTSKVYVNDYSAIYTNTTTG